MKQKKNDKLFRAQVIPCSLYVLQSSNFLIPILIDEIFNQILLPRVCTPNLPRCSQTLDVHVCVRLEANQLLCKSEYVGMSFIERFTEMTVERLAGIRGPGKVSRFACPQRGRKQGIVVQIVFQYVIWEGLQLRALRPNGYQIVHKRVADLRGLQVTESENISQPPATLWYYSFTCRGLLLLVHVSVLQHVTGIKWMRRTRIY